MLDNWLIIKLYNTVSFVSRQITQTYIITSRSHTRVPETHSHTWFKPSTIKKDFFCAFNLGLIKDMGKTQHLILWTTKGTGAQFHGFCGNFKFYPLVYFVFLFGIVCIYDTRVCVLAEPNCIVCLTLSRHILMINPGVFSSSQDTGTNRQTGWHHAEHISLPLQPSLKQHDHFSQSSQRLDPIHFQDVKVPWPSVIIIILFNLLT